MTPLGLSPRLREWAAARNVGLCKYLARRYRGRGTASWQDLLDGAFDGLMQALRNYDLSRGFAFKTFLGTCVKFALIAAIRSAKSRRRLERLRDCDVADPSAGTDGLDEAEEISHFMGRVKSSLGPKSWDLVKFRYVVGLSQPQTARLLRCSRQNVAQREKRILAKLREKLSGGR